MYPSIRATITVALLWVLMTTASITVAAQPVSANDEDEPLTMAEASAAALLQALEATPSVTWPDAPVPASLAEFVPVARELTWDRAFDAFTWPLYLRLVDARCNGDGGIALIFEEIRPLLPWRTYAYAVRGSMPTASDADWGGGTGLTSVLDDPEFVRSMGSDTFACPA